VIRRGQAIRQANPDVEINQVGSVVWGEKYLDAFMNFNVRSMLADGNMPALRRHGVLVHSIVTTDSGRQYILNHPVYKALARVADVQFFCFPEALLELFRGEHGPDKLSYLLYGILDHTNLFFARGLGGNLFLIPVDAVVAGPSFTNMRRYLEEGYDCCGAGNLVSERESFLPALERRFAGETAIDIDTFSLASLALQHPHHYITSQLIHDGNRDFGRHPRELFWPIKGGIAVHSIYTHPLAVSGRRLARKFIMPYAWADFLLPARLFPEPAEFDRYKIIDNAAEAYIGNFAPASRTYMTTGRPFHPEDFVHAHLHSYPIHRHMLSTRQIIPCEYPPMTCGNDVEQDMRTIRAAMAQHFDDSAEGVARDQRALRHRSCNLCGKTNLAEAIDLGWMPLTHQLRTDPDIPEKTYPVQFHLCMDCELLQMGDPIPADALYDADTYTTGFQKPKHIDDLICTAITHRDPESVLDVGCNDGSLLQALKAHGFMTVAGIEPNPHAAAIARERGFAVETNYLCAESTTRLLAGRPRFGAIFARHVLEHVTNLADFFACIDRLLADDGLFVIELPHVETGLFANNPVILWEEHVNYFTEACVRRMLASYGFEVIDHRYYAFGGGSVGFIARRSKVPATDLKGAGGFPLAYYQRYDGAIRELKGRLNDVITLARVRGFTIALYGAAPRSCILVNYAHLGDLIDVVIDDRAEIQERIMPGTRLPIRGLAQAQLPEGQPLLVLLGVGAESEHKIMEKLWRSLPIDVVSVSLFPPRNIWKSLDQAREAIEGSTWRQRSVILTEAKQVLEQPESLSLASVPVAETALTA
jgi:SAM-dependent methyltransferase